MGGLVTPFVCSEEDFVGSVDVGSGWDNKEAMLRTLFDVVAVAVVGGAEAIGGMVFPFGLGLCCCSAGISGRRMACCSFRQGPVSCGRGGDGSRGG